MNREVIGAPLPGLDLGKTFGHHQSPMVRANGLIFYPAWSPSIRKPATACTAR